MDKFLRWGGLAAILLVLFAAFRSAPEPQVSVTADKIKSYHAGPTPVATGPHTVTVIPGQTGEIPDFLITDIHIDGGTANNNDWVLKQGSTVLYTWSQGNDRVTFKSGIPYTDRASALTISGLASVVEVFISGHEF